MSHHSVKRLGILGDDENASSIYVVSLLMCAPPTVVQRQTPNAKTHVAV